MTNKLPSKFEIHAKYNPASRHVATLNDAGTKYRIEARDSLENAYNVPTELSVRFVQEALDEGSWIMTKIASVPVVERGLVFPFTAMHGSEQYQHEDAPESLFVVDKGTKEGFVKITWRDGEVCDNVWTVTEVEAIIKDAIWLVKHVGEKSKVPAEYKYMNSVLDKMKGSGFWIPPGSIMAGSLSYAPNSTYADKGGTETKVQAPDNNVIKLAIECETAGDEAAINRLAQAYENLAVSMESVITLQAQLKGVA